MSQQDRRFDFAELLIFLMSRVISEEVMRRGILALCDAVEQQVKASQTKIDDVLVLPLITALRGAVSEDVIHYQDKIVAKE